MMASRAQGLIEELAFWETVIATGGDWPDDTRHRLDPASELQESLRNLIPAPEGSVVRILDVGAGPLTSVGKRWDGREVIVDAIDPLADEYRALLERHGKVAPVPTARCEGENVALHFEADTFDIVYARNSLDHAEDPIACIGAMLTVVKPGCPVVLEHSVREAIRQNHAGLHAWDFFAAGSGPSFFIEGPFVGGHPFCVDVNARFGGVATFEVTQHDHWIYVLMRKNRIQ